MTRAAGAQSTGPAGGSQPPSQRSTLERFHLLSPLKIAWFPCLLVFLTAGFAADTNELEKSVQQLKQLPFEELLHVEVTTVAKRAERLVDSPSAVQVITSDDIHRSGVSSLAEALRLAPNLEVAQVDSRSEEHTSELQSLAYLVC